MRWLKWFALIIVLLALILAGLDSGLNRTSLLGEA